MDGQCCQNQNFLDAYITKFYCAWCSATHKKTHKSSFMTHSAQTCHLNTWQGLVPSSASPLPCSQMSLAWENSWLFATPPLVSPGKYRKIPKISPGHILFKGPFWGAYFWRGLSKEGNLRFTIDWANHIVRSKFTVFALFYFVFEGNIPSTSPRGTYIWRGDLTEGFLPYRIGGLY